MRFWSFASSSILFRFLLPPLLQLLLHIKHPWACIADVLHLIRLELELFQFERWICMQIYVPTFFCFGNSSGSWEMNTKVAILNNIASKWTSRSISFRACLLIYLLNLNRVRNLFFLFNTKVDPQILLLTGRLYIRQHSNMDLSPWSYWHSAQEEAEELSPRMCGYLFLHPRFNSFNDNVCMKWNANLVYFPSINLCYCALVFLFFIRSFRHNSKRVWVVL